MMNSCRAMTCFRLCPELCLSRHDTGSFEPTQAEFASLEDSGLTAHKFNKLRQNNEGALRPLRSTQDLVHDRTTFPMTSGEGPNRLVSKLHLFRAPRSHRDPQFSTG